MKRLIVLLAVGLVAGLTVSLPADVSAAKTEGALALVRGRVRRLRLRHVRGAVRPRPTRRAADHAGAGALAGHRTRRTSSARCSSTPAGREVPASSSSSAPDRSCSATRCAPVTTWSASTRGGSSSSDPLRCFRTLEEALSVFAPFAFPMTPDEEALVGPAGTTARLRLSAAWRLDPQSHGDGERRTDLDLLREAVGDPLLELRRVLLRIVPRRHYANLFPDRVGAVVVDGVLDPIAWTTGRRRRGARRSRSRPGCAATPAPRRRSTEFFRLVRRGGTELRVLRRCGRTLRRAGEPQLRAGPVVIEDPETGEVFLFGYADLIGVSLGPLYDSVGLVVLRRVPRPTSRRPLTRRCSASPCDG